MKTRLSHRDTEKDENKDCMNLLAFLIDSDPCLLRVSVTLWRSCFFTLRKPEAEAKLHLRCTNTTLAELAILRHFT